MFQFTREFIINDNGDGKGKLEGGVKFLAKKDASGNGTLYVDNMINIRAKDVNAIYKHPYEAEAKEKVVIKNAAISGINAGDLVRLVITLGKIGQTTATFNDYYPDHSRHLFYETVAPGTTGSAASAGDVINGLLKSIDNEAETLRGEKFVDIKAEKNTATPPAITGLVIEALDCYTVVKEVRIVTLPQAVGTSGSVAKIGALLTGYEDWNEILKWQRKTGSIVSEVEFTPGKEGNGNTTQILKNMRLQTAANLNPYGLDMDERPLPQGKYDQYTVEIVTERRHIGHDVMGSVGTSLTTIVFYVLRGTISKAFADELIKLTGNIIVVPAKTAEDLAVGNMSKQVLAHAADVPSYTEEEWDSTKSYDESSEE